MSNEELCDCLFSKDCKEEVDNYEILFELSERVETRYDSTFNNIKYYTITSKPPCESGYSTSSTVDGHTISIARTKEFVQEQKQLNPILHNTLNGTVKYQYHRGQNGDLVKDYIYLPTKNQKGNCTIYFNNDTIRIGAQLEIHFDINTKAFWSYGLYTNVDETKLVPGEIYETHILDNNKEYFKEDLKEFNGNSNLTHYKHTIDTKELGIQDYKGVFRILQKQSPDFENIEINFRYIVIE